MNFERKYDSAVKLKGESFVLSILILSSIVGVLFGSEPSVMGATSPDNENGDIGDIGAKPDQALPEPTDNGPQAEPKECPPGTFWNGKECEASVDEAGAEGEVPSVPFPEQEQPVLEPSQEEEPKKCPPGMFWNGSECVSGEHCITDTKTDEILCIPPDLTSKTPLQALPDKNG